MIKVEHLSYSFPEKDLYHKISFTIEEGQHCAFIGTSGTGKSTLIDILMDPEKYLYDGKIELRPNCRIGYVSQFPQVDLTKEITVFQYIADEFLTLQARINEICTEMETATDFDALMEQYQDALDAFEAIGGEDFENTITKKLNVADLGKHSDQLLSNLSGGEFKLVQVIKEMLTNPDVMIMDEPDVFLDFEHLNSLRNLINSHKGTMLVITHNRYLLNHCFDKILHLENKELQEFDGRYLEYNFNLLQEKIELQEQEMAEQAEIERNKLVVDKLRAAATYYTDAARGNALNARVSLLKRLEARKIKGPFVEIKQPEIQFETKQELDDTVVVNVTDYSVAFEETLLEQVTFSLNAKDKVAIIGANGTGKTTLLRDIYKNNNPAIAIGEGVKVAFLSQVQGEVLDESNTIVQEFLDAGFANKEEVLAHLTNYGFEEEILTQPIHSLSGGEKNLLQLAKVSASDANLLLLDEPTSHLDTYSQVALETALANFNGAILMISHDFYSIVNCMDYVLLIEDKTIRKVSMRKFRKMIYANHFNKDYLENEQKKNTVELRITKALKEKDVELAKSLSEELEALIKLL